MKGKKQAGKSAKGSAQKKVDWKTLEIVPPDAAGIDIGGSEHWVAISPDRDPEPVRRFGCFTVDLREMARWRIDKGVRSVAIAYASHCTSLGRCETFSNRSRLDNLTPLALLGGSVPGSS